MAVLALFLSACGGGGGGSSSSTPPPPSAPPTYQLTRLVSDQVSAGATTTDSHLVNPWGLAYGPTTTFWVANQGTATSTVYDGLGRMPSTPIVVTNPMVQGHAMGGPTGMVYSDSSGFRGDKFIVATLDGCICGWSAGATMDRRLDNSDSPAVYTGLAIGTSGTGTYLFAANFTAGTVDVFDSNYSPVSLGNTALVDPTLPAGFSPFNVQVLGGRLYVTYAKHDSPSLRETPGPGFGHVSVFNLEGRFVQRIASGGLLNAPWGLVLAPASFGPFGSALLVGNFGDGHITAFDATTGALRGQLAGPDTTPMVVSGLWGMAFGNGSSAGLINQLYVTAGPQGETHGMYGTISYGAPGGSGGGGGYGDGGY
jgi:uncharacterized protein (TIGR03118 family)